MVNAPLFLFYLITASGESWMVDRGIVRSVGTPTPLEYTPDGWQEIALGWERNLQKFGLVRSFSVSLGMYGDAARILRYLALTRGVDEKVYLLVQKRTVEVTDEDFAIEHRLYYKGEVDLSTYKINDGRVDVTIMEGGRSKELRAGEQTVYTYPLDAAPEAIRVRLDGIYLSQTGNLAVPDGIDISNKQFSFFTLPVAFINTEGSSTGVAFFGQELQPMPNEADYLANSTNYAVVVDEMAGGPITFPVVAHVPFEVTKNTINGFFWVEFMTNKGQKMRFGASGNAAGGSYAVDINTQITLAPGERLFITAALWSNVTGAVEMAIRTLPNAPMAFSYRNRYRPSFTKCLRPLDLFGRIVEKLCGDRSLAVSQLLAATTFCLTSGDAVRGLSGAELKTSLADYYQACWVQFCAGLGVEDEQVVLEGWRHFFTDDVEIDLGEVKSCVIEPATDLMANAIKAGYEDQNYDDVNGRYEFNSLVQLSTPAKRVVKPLELVSRYRADPYGIELTRRNLEGKKTTDSQGDNDVFWLDVDLANPQADAEGTYYNLRRPAYEVITGVPDPELIFNTELSPAHIISRWGDYLRSVLYQQETGVVRPESFTKNRELYTKLAGVVLDEDAAIPVARLGALAFKPTRLTVVTQAPVSLPAQLAQTPRACFRFSYKGIPLRGFMLKAGQKPKERDEQTFIFLSHPLNDLTLFV